MIMLIKHVNIICKANTTIIGKIKNEQKTLFSYDIVFCTRIDKYYCGSVLKVRLLNVSGVECEIVEENLLKWSVVEVK